MELNRLKSLIEYTQESARLNLRPTYDVSCHEFYAFEHTFQGLPGIHFNCGSEGREVWISVDRLPETKPPEANDQRLKAWLQPSDNPNVNPTLRESIELEIEQLQDLNEPISSSEMQSYRKTTLLGLSEYKNKSEVQSLFSIYVNSKWLPWAAEERKRRQTIKLYNKLFKLKQQLEGSLGDDQVEMVWGTGMAVGKVLGRKVCHPILTLAADIQVNTETMALEIVPCNTEDQLEIDVFISTNNPGVVDLERAFFDFTKSRTQTLSPFDPSSFEPILLAAARNLDAEGIYWPHHTTPDDRLIPNASKDLCITDTWVLMMRPRSKSIMIQDLKRFRNQLECDEIPEIPCAVRVLLNEPSQDHVDVQLPNFRGLSPIPIVESNSSTNETSIRDLFFPLPFNEQQAQIIQFLECYNGVVVQGPPGTGKTHTIANVISHYLALGKRVLVTSMKEPALSLKFGGLSSFFKNSGNHFFS